jgi:hypothetical protein
MMRAAIVATVVPVACVFLLSCAGNPEASPAVTPPGWNDVDFSALPGDEAALGELNSRQRRMVRRAENTCSAETGGGMAGPCVIGRVDRAVARDDDPALTAFHYALPVQHRYDSQRPSTVWKRVHSFVPPDPAQ